AASANAVVLLARADHGGNRHSTRIRALSTLRRHTKANLARRRSRGRLRLEASDPRRYQLGDTRLVRLAEHGQVRPRNGRHLDVTADPRLPAVQRIAHAVSDPMFEDSRLDEQQIR